ncbi:Beta-1 [Abeliophyllum distichum]|uniref:Beta-1 n=1 Tax=Abeliophyllum distichum TaxID=126358 RepID=A0ABD1TZ80_9LAMI
MVSIVQFLCLVFVLIPISVLHANKCSTSDIVVTQNKSGTVVKTKPEFDVTLFNACPCPVVNVKLACNGFKTVEKIDPQVLVANGNQCHLPQGSLIAPFSGYVFSYSWDSEFEFKVVSSETRCDWRK